MLWTASGQPAASAIERTSGFGPCRALPPDAEPALALLVVNTASHYGDPRGHSSWFLIQFPIKAACYSDLERKPTQTKQRQACVHRNWSARTFPLAGFASHASNCSLSGHGFSALCRENAYERSFS